MDDIEAHPIPGTQGAEFPFFSPDGKWLAFFAAGDLLRIPADGGSPITIARSLLPVEAWWARDNRIIIATQSVTRQRAGFSAIPASGGTPKVILASDTAHKENLRAGIDIPDGHFLFTSLGPGGIEDDNLAIGRFGSSKYTVLDLLMSHPLGYVDDYCLCFSYDGVQGSIVAVPLDLNAQKMTGDPITLRTGVGSQEAVALSSNGTLAYVSGNFGTQLVYMDAAGKVDTVLAEVRGYADPRLSPDGKMIAVWLPGGTIGDVWIYNVAAKTLSRLTSGSGAWPEWTPDSRTIVYVKPKTAGAGVYMQPVDGSAPAQRINVKFPTRSVVEWAGMSRDQTALLLTAATGAERRNIYYFRPGVDSVAMPWLATQFDEVTPRFSPDGKWVAYVSDESGNSQVYVRPFPGPGGRVQISNAGGDEPVWSRDGRKIFYRNGSKLTEADVTEGAGFSVTGRRARAALNSPGSEIGAEYDVAPDGRVLFGKTVGGEGKLVVVTNWLSEARRKIREAKK